MRGAWRLALLLAPLCSTVLAAQSAPTVERVGPARVSADPGRPVTAVFRVRNASTAPATAELSLPRGWPSVTPDAAAPLEGGASAVRIAGTVVPRGAAAGVYLLRYRLRSAASASADSLSIEVRGRREIAVSVEEVPRFAVAGAAYAVTFLVANRGNARAAVRLRTESGRGLPARLETPSLDLAPGESREVRVTVTTRAAEGALAHRVALAATQAADASATAEARVQVVPRAEGGGSGLHTLPVRVRLHARQGADASGGFPAEVSASGPLPRGDVHLDLFYRGRGAAAPEMGEQEQLSLALRSPRGELKAGDQLWTLSPLTAPGRFGSGAGGRVNAGAAWAEGFSERNRFVPGSSRVTAAALGMGDHRRSVALSYAARDGDGALTLRARARPARGVGVDAEAGAAGGARAAYLHAYAGGPRVSVDLRGIEADAGFPGEQRGRSLRQAHAAARPVDGLRLHAGYDAEARADTSSLLLAPKEARTATLRAGASIADAVTLERRVETREGDGAGGPWSRAAASWVATASLRLRRVILSGGAQAGTVDDRLAGGESSFGRIWARVGGAVGRHSFWAAADRSSGTSVETGRGQERVSGSAGVALQPASATRISLSVQAGALAWAEEPNGQVDGTIEQRLPGGHTLRLRVRAFPWADEGSRRPIVRLDYALPLRLPVGRAPDAGTVSGRVVDEETGRPVADALVRVGGRAVLTDARGRWAVAGVAPGRYAVEIDPVSVGVGRVVVRPDALAVEVAGGGSRRVEVGVSRAARLEGAVTIPDADSGAAGVGGAVVELRREGERRRRVTDAAGRFLFADLEPGRWTLAVVRADLPPHHALERESVEVELAPGGAEQVALRAIAKKREMRIVAGGDVVLDAPAARGAAPAVLPAPRLPAGVTMLPAADSTAPGVKPRRPPAPASVAANATEPAREPTPAARRTIARPWRERGESGFSDWANDSYVVQPGDESLTAIAWLVYRDGALWPKLWAANRDLLPTPDRIEPGMELDVPPLAPLTADERAALRDLRDRRR